MKKITIALLSLVIFQLSFAISQEEISKVTSILEKVDHYYQKNKKLKGYFSLYVNQSKRNGYFLFQAPDKLKLFFGPEKNDEPEKYSYMITNGNILWVYLPQYKVLVEQEIPEYFKQVGKLGMGLSRLLAAYKDLKVNKKRKNGKTLTVLTLSQPSKNMPYQELSFTIDSEGFVSEMKGKAVQGKEVNYVSFYRYGIRKNPKIEKKDFQVKPSGDIQILRNVLVKTKK